MNPAPPRASSSLGRWAAVGLALLLVAGGTVIYFFNPSLHRFYPVCQFHRLTGLNCPGCGATRAAFALLHGNWLTALRDNALFVIGIPLLLARGAWGTLNRWRGRSAGPFLSNQFVILLLVVIFAFGILRNLPTFAFLSP